LNPILLFAGTEKNSRPCELPEVEYEASGSKFGTLDHRIARFLPTTERERDWNGVLSKNFLENVYPNENSRSFPNEAS
jgi:hypothetical protein